MDERARRELEEMFPEDAAVRETRLAKDLRAKALEEEAKSILSEIRRAEGRKAGDPYRIAVDFDGVVNSYVSGWTGPTDLPDPPVSGAIEWLEEMAKSFEVVIFTTRGQYPEAIMAIRNWLAEHGYCGPLLAVTHKKPAALVYLDDRAIRFEGVFPTKEEIHRARPWRATATAEPPK